jgi:PAS domain S-box-containing protein
MSEEGSLFEQQITELRARVAELEGAEAAREDARLFADSIVDTVREPLLVLTADFRVETANRSFYREFKVSPEQTKDHLLYELGNGQWNIPELKHLLEVILLDSHSFEGFEVEHTFPHLGRQMMLLNARRLYHESNHTERILLAIENITERKVSERALREGEHRLKIAVETAKLGTWELDLTTGVLECSAQCKANFGISPDAPLPYEEILRMIHTEDLPLVRQALEKAVSDGIDYRAEYRAYWPDTSLHWIVASGRALYDESGQPFRMVGVTLDATERKRAELALEQANVSLRRSNDDLEEFARVASHDLKSPLRTVVTFAQLLENKYSDKLGDDAREYISFITGNAARMQALIDDLLLYSQVSAANMEMKEALVSAEDVLQISLANLQGVIAESGAHITHDALPLTTALDATHLLQIFQNLIGNAIHYRGTQPPRIHISAIKSENGSLQFSVRDNGIGIAHQYRDQIFEPFKRLHGNERPGSGIGLAVCKKILDRHAGRIWVESKVGQGSTFYFTIPS